MPKTIYRAWTEAQLRLLHIGSEKHTPTATLARQLNRTIGALRQKARHEGISLGVMQRTVTTRQKKYYARKRLGLGPVSAHA